MHKGSSFSVSSPTLSLFFKTIAILMGAKWCLVVLIYVSLMTDGVEHLFMGLYEASCVIFCEKCSSPLPILVGIVEL